MKLQRGRTDLFYSMQWLGKSCWCKVAQAGIWIWCRKHNVYFFYVTPAFQLWRFKIQKAIFRENYENKTVLYKNLIINCWVTSICDVINLPNINESFKGQCVHRNINIDAKARRFFKIYLFSILKSCLPTFYILLSFSKGHRFNIMLLLSHTLFVSLT